MSIPEDSFTLNSLKFDVKSSNDIESIIQENGNSKITYQNGDTYEGTVNEINMKQGKYKNGVVISNKIENILEQNPDYGDDLKELDVIHWSQQKVFNKS